MPKLCPLPVSLNGEAEITGVEAAWVNMVYVAQVLVKLCLLKLSNVFVQNHIFFQITSHPTPNLEWPFGWTKFFLPFTTLRIVCARCSSNMKSGGPHLTGKGKHVNHMMWGSNWVGAVWNSLSIGIRRRYKCIKWTASLVLTQTHLWMHDFVKLFCSFFLTHVQLMYNLETPMQKLEKKS